MNFSLYPWQDSPWKELEPWRAAPPHAVLLFGPRGIGKAQLAKAFGASLLCGQLGQDGQACGHCEPCRWLGKDMHPDFVLLQPESAAEGDEIATEEGAATKDKRPSEQIAIAQVRELLERLNLGSHRGGRRVILIEPAHALNLNAANALLKTLEEPPQGTTFLLTTHETNRLPKTVLSRCAKFRVERPAREASLGWLGTQSIEEAERALRFAAGAPLDALRFAQADNIRCRETLIGALAKSHRPAVTELAAALQTFPLRETVTWLMRWTHDLIACRVGAPLRYFTEDAKSVERTSLAISTAVLLDLWHHLVAQIRVVDHPLNARLFLESLLLPFLRAQSQA